MLPELTHEYLLIMLVYELYFYIDNTDDKITKKDLFEICNNAIKADLDKLADNERCRFRYFRKDFKKIQEG